MDKQHTDLYITAFPLPPEKSGENKYRVAWHSEHLAAPDIPVSLERLSAEAITDIVAVFVATAANPQIRTMRIPCNHWGFEAILCGSGAVPVSTVSPYISTAKERACEDVIYRMQQCKTKPALGGWRRYTGVDKYFHEMLLYPKDYKHRMRVLQSNPLFARFMFLSPSMRPEGLVDFVEMVGDPRWFATSQSPDGADELKGYFGVGKASIKYPGRAFDRLQKLRATWGLTTGTHEHLDLLRRRVKIAGGTVDETDAMIFMIEYLAANWLHVLHQPTRSKNKCRDLDFFIPEYFLHPDEVQPFHDFVNHHNEQYSPDQAS